MKSSGLTRLYIFALSLVALLSVLGQVLIQHALKQGSEDAYIVNMAGRQRMLSQRICKYLLLLQSPAHPDKKAFLEELESSFLLWEKFHYGLSQGNSEIGLEGNNSDNVKRLFEQLDPYYRRMSENIKLIIRQYPEAGDEYASLNRSINLILVDESVLLKIMNDIVAQYEKEAREKVAYLQRMELALLLLTIIVFIFEGVFIFRPAVNRINKGVADLMVSENNTREANIRLEEAQKRLKKINDELEQTIEERTRQVRFKNQELELKNEMFTRMNKDLETFVYTASHDLKAPISNIEGLVEALSPKIAGSPDAEELVFMMKTSISKFRSVLQELSDIGKAKVEAGGEVLTVKFKDVLEEIKLTTKDLIDSTGAVIADDFTAAPEVKLSQKNLRSILYNLVSNAIKYRSPDRLPLIRVVSDRKNDHILLQVSDNGVGIKKEDIESIFSMYTRLTSNVEGTGLGLSIVKSILDNSRGRIEVESQPRVGSVFTVYLPLNKI